MKKIIMILSIIFIASLSGNNIYAYDEEYEEQNKVYTKEEIDQIQEKVNKKLNQSKSKYSYRPTVVIDPGHGGKDSGALSSDRKFKEKDLNLDISRAIEKYLNDNGVDVVMTRTTDEWLELKERSTLSNSLSPALFVSVHNDTSEGNGNGAHAIYSLKDKNGGPSKTLANNVLNSIVQNTTQNKSSRGAWTREGDSGRDYYHVIREVESPSIIIECSFMNSTDIKAVDTLEKRKIMGNAIGKGILKTLNEIDIPSKNFGVEYTGHVQGIGWQNWTSNGKISGTVEQYKRLEGMKIKLKDAPRGTSITYRGHVEGIGWMPWVSDGELVGTVEQSKRLEAIEIKLKGAPQGSHVEYRTHVEGIGWMPWVRDGQLSGTIEQWKRIEAIEIKITNNNSNSSSSNDNTVAPAIDVDYRGHVQGIGWMPWMSNNAVAGTVEEYRRLEGLNIKLKNAPNGASIKYRGHVEGIGWMPWMSDGQLVGTVEQSKRLEAIEIKLEGLPKSYHVEYRTHVEGIGWMPWKADGQLSGTIEQWKRIEAIQMRILNY